MYTLESQYFRKLNESLSKESVEDFNAYIKSFMLLRNQLKLFCIFLNIYFNLFLKFILKLE